MGLTLDEAKGYCRRLSAVNDEKQAGRGYRLPTKLEWLCASEAGAKTRFSFGNDGSDVGKYAWFSENSAGRRHPVGSLAANPWGLYDMQGNVSEWTSTPCTRSREGETFAGGSHFLDGRQRCKHMFTYGSANASRDNKIGIRLVCELQQRPK
jgi:formylglycine-generating enzyme required for sulfatase activity